jgi:hypothetical protein
VLQIIIILPKYGSLCLDWKFSSLFPWSCETNGIGACQGSKIQNS